MKLLKETKKMPPLVPHCTGSMSKRNSRIRLCARNSTKLRIPRRSTSTSLRSVLPRVLTKENTSGDNNALNREGPGFCPCNPDLAACCQNFAAFVANHAAKSSTNGKFTMPSAGFIYGYMRVLFYLLKLEPECCVYAYIYIKRLLSQKGTVLKIRAGNWKKILVGVLLLATKFVDDVSVKNCDFAKALYRWSRSRVNILEVNILTALNWEAHVPISEYTVRYFELARPRKSTCDWGVEPTLIAKYFNVRSTALAGLFRQILEPQQNASKSY